MREVLWGFACERTGEKRMKRKNEVDGAKACSVCLTKFPATSEHFHRDASRLDGLRSECRKCRVDKVRDSAREYARRTSEARADYQSIYYQTVTLPKRRAKAEARSRNRSKRSKDK